MISRRAFTAGVLVSLPLLAAARKGRAVKLGIQTYSFRDMLGTPGDMVDKMIAGMKTLQLDFVELFEPTIQPPTFSTNAAWRVAGGKPTQASVFGRPPEGPPSAEELEARANSRRWRLETPITYFEAIGQRFRKNGITIQGYNCSLKDYCTDAEIDRTFEITRALGTDLLTMSTTVTMAPRLVPFAEKHRVRVGFHGHSNLRDPVQMATPESFDRALSASPLFYANLDLGHFAAAGFDGIDFIERHAPRICSIHLKDRKAHDGMNVPFGQGDTPIRAVVRLVRDKYPQIPLILEYEFAGGGSVAELARARDFIDAALA